MLADVRSNLAGTFDGPMLSAGGVGRSRRTWQIQAGGVTTRIAHGYLRGAQKKCGRGVLGTYAGFPVGRGWNGELSLVTMPAILSASRGTKSTFANDEPVQKEVGGGKGRGPSFPRVTADFQHNSPPFRQ